MSLSDVIRRAIRESPRTQRQLAADSGVSEAQISRFLRGDPLRSDTVDRLAAALGLTVVSMPEAETVDRIRQKYEAIVADLGEISQEIYGFRSAKSSTEEK